MSMNRIQLGLIRTYSMVSARRDQIGQVALFLFGIGLLSFGLADGALAADGFDTGLEPEVNQERIAQAVKMLFTMLEGAFGALVCVGAGLGAILSAAFGQYKAALGCLVVAVGSFILRALVMTFFNTQAIEEQGW